MIKIIIIAIAGGIFTVTIRDINKTMGTLVMIATSVLLTFFVARQLTDAAVFFNSDFFNAFKNKQWLNILFKGIFITYTAQMGEYLCLDMGFESFALKIKIISKLMLFALIAPKVAEIYIYIIKLI